MKKILLYLRIGIGVCFGLSVLFVFLGDPYISNSDRYSESIFFSIIAGILGFLSPNIIKKNIGRSSKEKLPRRGFTEEQKADARHRQNGICLRCRQYPSIWEYHHRDGDRSNNRTSNCEAICPTCHAKIERGLD